MGRDRQSASSCMHRAGVLPPWVARAQFGSSAPSAAAPPPPRPRSSSPQPAPAGGGETDPWHVAHAPRGACAGAERTPAPRQHAWSDGTAGASGQTSGHSCARLSTINTPRMSHSPTSPRSSSSIAAAAAAAAPPAAPLARSASVRGRRVALGWLAVGRQASTCCTRALHRSRGPATRCQQGQADMAPPQAPATPRPQHASPTPPPTSPPPPPHPWWPASRRSPC